MGAIVYKRPQKIQFQKMMMSKLALGAMMVVLPLSVMGSAAAAVDKARKIHDESKIRYEEAEDALQETESRMLALERALLACREHNEAAEKDRDAKKAALRSASARLDEAVTAKRNSFRKDYQLDIRPKQKMNPEMERLQTSEASFDPAPSRKDDNVMSIAGEDPEHERR